MAKKRASKGSAAPVDGDQTGDPALDFRHHHARRLNNPTAGNAPEGKVERTERKVYPYDPHRPPTLRYDATGRADAVTDRMAALLAEAQSRPLTPDEAAELADALRQGQPWLEWAGKREQPAFVVDAPAIHLHERVSARALLRVAARKDVQRSLFGESDLSYSQSVQFYHHAVNWANRLILGDNRAVMASLAHREGLAGKIQMIYIDPPYGIKFASNFQPEIAKRNVRESDSDLTREVEMVQAYRDTWNLGVHSYLSYLSLVLIEARRMLADSGSCFVQIGEDNIHSVRDILDEVFGRKNFVRQITVKKTGGAGSFAGGTNVLASVNDYLLWYAKDMDNLKYRELWVRGAKNEESGYRWLRLPDGRFRGMNSREITVVDAIPEGARVYKPDNFTSQTVRDAKTTVFPVRISGRLITPLKGGWKTNQEGMNRLLGADRVHEASNSIQYVRYNDDFKFQALNNSWTDTGTGNFTEEKVYVVQTSSKIVERCLLMTTDPGDLGYVGKLSSRAQS